ncbi:hypothetical protein SLA2020_128370 [Shorea laevis]
MFGQWMNLGFDGTRTKLLRIGPLWRMVIHLLFMKSDERLIEESGQMVSYNLTTKQIKKLPVYGGKEAFQACINNRVSLILIHMGNIQLEKTIASI